MLGGVDRDLQHDEFLHVVSDQLPKAMFFRVVHPHGEPYRFTYVSRGVQEVFGITAEHLLAHPEAMMEVIAEEDRPAFLQKMGAALSTLSPFDMICRLRWPDGSAHWCHFRTGHRIGPDGATLCEGIALDITAEQEAQQRLIDTQAEHQAILAALPDLMFLMSADGVYLDAHYRDRSALLRPPEEFLGRNMFDVLPPALAEQVARGLDRVKTDGSAVVDYVVPINGERRFYEARMVRCGQDRVLAIVRDVTDAKRSQTEAHLHRLELAHVSRVTLLAETTASIAHELNQPLTAIVSNAQAAQYALAAGESLEGDYRNLLDDIVEAGQRAGDVIKRLRSWLNRDEFLPRPVDVNQMIRHVEHVMRSEVILRHVRLSLELEPDLKPVSADMVQLQQVIMNLAINAIDAMDGRSTPDRQVIIRTTAAGDEVHVSVHDNGMGIAPENMERLFDAFFSTKPGGLGIGLRICSSIVKAHGGRMWARNNNDAGATFGFALPAVSIGHA